MGSSSYPLFIGEGICFIGEVEKRGEFGGGSGGEGGELGVEGGVFKGLLEDRGRFANCCESCWHRVLFWRVV